MGKTYKKERIDIDRQSKSNKNHLTNKKKGKYNKNEFFQATVKEYQSDIQYFEYYDSLERNNTEDE